jgi:ABC-2 type transport system permease protein
MNMRVRNLKVVALLELKRFWNNKPLVLQVAVAPILICIVFGFVAYTFPEAIKLTVYVDRPPLSVIDPEVAQLIPEIKKIKREKGSKTFSVNVDNTSQEQAIRKLQEGKTRAVLILKQGHDGLEEAKIIMDVTELVITNETTQALLNLLTKYSKKTSFTHITQFLANRSDLFQAGADRKVTQVLTPFDISTQTLAWIELRFFDFHASAMMMILAMSIPLFLSLNTITSERVKGTLERIFVTPYSRTEIIGGKMLAFSVLAVIIALLVTLTLKAVFNIALGNPALILLTTILVGMNGVVFGLLISSLTRTEAESVLVGILCIFALMGLMTYIVPWETMHPGARLLSRFLPYTYGIQAIRRINMNGAGFSDVWVDLTILLVAIFIQLFIAIPVLRREIK